MKILKVAILGGSGYTGLELLRILSVHPGVKVVNVTSRQHKGGSVEDAFPFLRGHYGGLKFTDPEEFSTINSDVAFCALPHGASQEVVPHLLKSGIRVVDLSADFRLRDERVYNKWYEAHKAPELLKKAVYGLPELYRSAIKKATLVANPGCYPTSAILALAPLAKKGLISGGGRTPGSIIIDSKSGASGAGRQAAYETSFVEVYGAFKAYKVGSHRHTPEIEQELGAGGGKPASVTFTPHLLPVSRGILTTAYAALSKGLDTEKIHGLYSRFYAKEPFVRVLPPGKFPDISQVRASNYCDIGVWADRKKKQAIIVSAIDNLVKGASGQAVQNMNIICGFKEDTALNTPAVSF